MKILGITKLTWWFCLLFCKPLVCVVEWCVGNRCDLQKIWCFILTNFYKGNNILTVNIPHPPPLSHLYLLHTWKVQKDETNCWLLQLLSSEKLNNYFCDIYFQATKFTADHVDERIEAFIDWYVNDKLKVRYSEKATKISHFVLTLLTK